MNDTLPPRIRAKVCEAVAWAVRDAALKSTTADLPALALRLNVSLSSVKRWRDIKGWPNYETARRLAPLFGVDPETGRKVSK